MAQTKEAYLQEEGFRSDGTERLPICFCIDASGSMLRTYGGRPTGRTLVEDGITWTLVEGGTTILTELQNGMQMFFDKISSDKIAANAAEISIVTFNDIATSILDFCRLSDFSRSITNEIRATGNTYMGEGLNMALDKLDRCIEKYREYEIGCYSPWLIIMSDGAPNGSSYELNNAKRRIENMYRRMGLTVIPIGIGKEADMRALSSLSPNSNASSIHNVNFKQLFNNMSIYIRSIAQTSGTMQVKMDVNKITNGQLSQNDVTASDTIELDYGGFDFLDEE